MIKSGEMTTKTRRNVENNIKTSTESGNSCAYPGKRRDENPNPKPLWV